MSSCTSNYFHQQQRSNDARHRHDDHHPAHRHLDVDPSHSNVDSRSSISASPPSRARSGSSRARSDRRDLASATASGTRAGRLGRHERAPARRAPALGRFLRRREPPASLTFVVDRDPPGRRGPPSPSTRAHAARRHEPVTLHRRGPGLRAGPVGQRPRRPRDHRPAQARRLRHDLQPGARERQHARLRQGEAQPRHLRRPAGVAPGSRRGTPSPDGRAAHPARPCPPTPPADRGDLQRGDRRPRRDVRDPGARGRRRGAGLDRRPAAVPRRGGARAVVGFARVAPYSPRPAYAGVGEHGVYVARGARGDGVGRRLWTRSASPRTPPACTSSRRGSSATTPPASPRTSRPASTSSASSAATPGSTAHGRTACSSSGCWARRPPARTPPSAPRAGRRKERAKVRTSRPAAMRDGRAHRRRRRVPVVEQREEQRRQHGHADRVAELLDRVQRARRGAHLVVVDAREDHVEQRAEDEPQPEPTTAGRGHLPARRRRCPSA